jgi:hypothetical protein
MDVIKRKNKIKLTRRKKGLNKITFGIAIVATFATKPRITLGSTTLIIIGQFYKLLKTFPEVVLTLTSSSGCQP